MSAQFTRDPMALASALGRIEQAIAPTSSIKKGCAHLCIVDPLGPRAAVTGLLATHPPMALRVARLKAMAHRWARAAEPAASA
jgi:heat shock protein HtpX